MVKLRIKTKIMSIRSKQTLNAQCPSSRTEKLSISIGGTNCAIMSQDTRFLDLLRARYQWFESSGPAVYEILVSPLPLEELASGDMALPPYPLVKKVNSGDSYIIGCPNSPFVAVANTSSKKVLAKIGNSPYFFDNFLCVLYNLILTNEDGLLLHASAVSERGQGCVFFGPFGSGKSTVARLSEGRSILTYDLALIKPHHGGYRVYGTPFQGDFMLRQSHARVELNGLYLLKKDLENGLRPLDKAQAVKELCGCVLSFSNDSHLMSRIHNTCRNLVDAVPVYELHFRPDPSFWQVMNEPG
ncbi:MAG: hypothetical protein A2144_15025 [Chloroflexi bacterium RBG_16_50_9]|nr:MAG: hypothetical protein A2144_15025 [Chloroflexi bacterium RBG_16_50_9]